MTRNRLPHLITLPARRPVVTLVVTLLCALLSLLAVRRLAPTASLEKMFPRDDPAAASLVRVHNGFAAAEALLLLVTLPDDHPTGVDGVNRLLAYARRLEAAVANSPEAQALSDGLVYRADDQTREFFEKVLVPAGLFYLDDASFDAARQRLTRAEMARQIQRNEAMIAAPGPAADALGKVLLQDPLHLNEFIRERLASGRPLRTHNNSDAFISEDGTSLLIRIVGKRPPSDLEFSTKITSVFAPLIEQANIDHLDVDVAGAYAIAAASASSIRHDMIWSVNLAIASLALLFAIVYRRSFQLFFLGFTPVALGILFGFGAYSLFSTDISPLSAVIGGILAGMGIDYSIHYLSHYHVARSLGGSSADAAGETVLTLGASLVAAMATSIAGFVAIGMSSVPALRDFALLGGLGLCGAFIGTVVVLPALVVLLDRWRAKGSGFRVQGSEMASLNPEPRTPNPSSPTFVPSCLMSSCLPLPRFSIAPLLQPVARRPMTPIAICLLIAAASLAVVASPGEHLPLESDLSVMHPRPNPPLDAQRRIARKMGGDAGSFLIHLRAETPGQLLSLAHRVNRRLETPAVRAAGVKGAWGLATLLPDPAVAETRLAAVKPAEVDQILADFRAVIGDSIFEPKAYDPYAVFLRILLTRQAAPAIADLLPYRRLAEGFLPSSAVAGGAPPTEAIALILLDNPVQDRVARDAIITAIRASLADLPGATLTGMSVVSHDTERTIHRDLPRLVGGAIGLVVLYLLIQFRNLKDSLLAVLPALFSMICLFAFMRLSGQKLNMVNLISIPLLIGIAVDYGIFLVSLARAARRGDVSASDWERHSFASCHAILLCATTTLLGFGSLAFTSVPAIRSLGWAVGVGVISALAATLFLLFPILAGSSRKRNQGSGFGVQGGEGPGDVSASLNVNPSSLNPEPRTLKPFVPLLIAIPLLLTACSAPSGRLTFPTSPIVSTPGHTWYDVNRNGKPDFALLLGAEARVVAVGYDDDEDGQIDREYRLADYANDAVPHLIILLDSIPFQGAADRYAAGGFRFFDPPQKIIPPFPSLTEVCYTELTHAPPRPAMIDQYYDPASQRMHNGLWDRVRGYEEPWERRLEYHAKFWEGGLSYLQPRPWYGAEMERVRKALDRSPDRVSLVYVISASGMLCRYGAEGMKEVLDEAERLCLQLLHDRRGAIKISLLADHGHNLMASRNIRLDKTLKQAGFNPTSRLSGNNDVVLEINGLVTYAGIYTARPAKVADAILTRPEIELAMYIDGDRVIVRDARGAAAIECAQGKIRYKAIDRDVLQYQDLLQALAREGKVDAGGFVSDEDWLDATHGHEWPDAPRRIWNALHGQVVHAPQLLFTVRDGYCIGDPAMEKFITMQSSHGGLNQVNSATFVMSMTGRITGPLRTRDVLGRLEPGWQFRAR